ncbi:translational activator of GCN4 [Gonapodya sp. JEL0774]|nr:translational activator of GCN4 [Gonapodya sp. JEL0774]
MADDRAGITDWDDDDDGVQNGMEDVDDDQHINGFGDSQSGSDGTSGSNDEEADELEDVEDIVTPYQDLSSLEWPELLEALETRTVSSSTRDLLHLWETVEIKIRKHGIPEAVFPPLLAVLTIRCQLYSRRELGSACGRVVAAALRALAPGTPDGLELKRVVATVDKARKSTDSVVALQSIPSTLPPTLTVLLNLIRPLSLSQAVKCISLHIPRKTTAIHLYLKGVELAAAKDADNPGLAALVGAGWTVANGFKSGGEAVVSSKPAIVSWFATNILSLPRNPAQGVVDALVPFVRSWNERDIENLSLVAEKVIPRTPEVACQVLADIAEYLSSSPAAILTRTSSSVIDILKSTSTPPTIRSRSLLCFQRLVASSIRVSQTVPSLELPANMLLSAISSRPPSAEARTALYAAVGALALPGTLSPTFLSKIVDVLLTCAAKETSDATLGVIVESLGAYVAVEGTDVLFKVLDFILSSVWSSKTPGAVRRAWIVRLSDMLPPTLIASQLEISGKSKEVTKSLLDKAVTFAVRTSGLLGGDVVSGGAASPSMTKAAPGSSKSSSVPGKKATASSLPTPKAKDSKDVKDPVKDEVPAGDVGELWSVIGWLLKVARRTGGGVATFLQSHSAISLLLSLSPPRSPLFAERHLVSKPSGRDSLLLSSLITSISADVDAWRIVDKQAWNKALGWCGARGDLSTRRSLRHNLRRGTTEHMDNGRFEIVTEIANSVGEAVVGALAEIQKERMVLVQNASLTGSAGEENESVARAWPEDRVRTDGALALRAWELLECVVPSLDESSNEDQQNAVESMVLGALVVGNHEELARISAQEWTHFVQIKLRAPPHDLLQRHASSLVSSWTSSFSAAAVPAGILGSLHPDSEPTMRRATISAMKLLVLHAPECVPHIAHWCVEKLLTEDALQLSAEDVAIWRTPLGSLHFDPVEARRSKQGQRDDRPRTKVEKWEADMRKELEKKKTAAGNGDGGLTSKKPEALKLTKEEQGLRDLQMKKEAEIRKKVQSVVGGMETAMDVLQSVVEGGLESRRSYPEAAISLEDPLSLSSGAVSHALLSVVKRELTDDRWRPDGFMPHAVVCGQKALDIWVKIGYLVLGKLCKPGLPVVQMAVLRVLGIKQLDPDEGDEGMDGSWLKGKTEAQFKDKVISGAVALAKAIGAASSDDLELEDSDFGEEFPPVASVLQIPGETDEDFILEAISGTFHAESVVREASLAALEFLEPVAVTEDLKDRLDLAVWIQKFDDNGSVSRQAQVTWRAWNGEANLSAEHLKSLVRSTVHEISDIRSNAGRSLAATLHLYPEAIASTLQLLYTAYQEQVAPAKPTVDDFGMVARSTLEPPNAWEIRQGIAKALTQCSSILTQENTLGPFFNFLIDNQALGDKSESVRGEMLNASITAISKHGKTHIQEILPIFDGYLSKTARPTETADRIREAVVISLGTLAKDLEPSDPHVGTVVEKLIETLSTPSETVQVAVSECLPPLIRSLKENASAVIARLLRTLFEGTDYASRRGAAYGLAGAVKGRGLSALKEYNIITILKEASEDKKVKERREGAAMAYETLTLTLGRLFEPYIIQIIPVLLPLFGDSSKDVRDAAWEASKAIMSKISAHGVKLVLPSLLAGLDDKNWRSKAGSIELLGSMAAKEAMDRFGEVIKNPEVQTIIPLLLGALVDPNKQTALALTSLLETAFVHYIDAPSLAVIVPILNRGMRERSTDTRKKAAQIIGNMSSVTDPRDLVPYLPELVPQVRTLLADPVPEARAISAKALGTLVHKLGEENFPGLVSDLIQTLKSEQSATVDRSGAAQGLSEVLSSLPIERLESLLPEVVSNASSVRPFVREGFVTLLVYLPATFRERFQPYLGMCIPVILRGLADETEAVRDASLRAGQMVIKNYSASAMELLLPELEKGLFDENWRIRQSSITLLGDLLYRVVGISGRTQMDGGDEATLGTEAGRRALLEALGPDRYQNIMAAVYIVRNDSNLVVRNTSLHVWKSVVTNTPRTLKEILGTMMSILIDSLASTSYDKRSVAARTLSDLVRKLGEQVLQEILPVFEDGMDSDNPDTRQGVCIGVSEVLSNVGRNILEEFEEDFIPIVQKGLMDSDADVREAAAQAFDTLHEQIGSLAIDEIIPAMLKELKGGESATFAMEGLKSVMNVRGQVVFPVLLPTLLHKPITAENARILGSLIAVAGTSLARRLSNIMAALMDSLQESNDEEVSSDVLEAVKSLARAIDEDTLHLFMSTLFESFKDDTPGRQKHTCTFVGLYFSENRLSAATQYIPDWIGNLIGLFNSTNRDICVAAWTALDSLIKSVQKEELDRYVSPMRRALASLFQHLSLTDEVPGFNLPKGISPVLAVFNQGVLVTSSDIREASAQGISDLVAHTGAEALKPFSTQIAGPLIRIITDRIQPPVKAAILDTLRRLLEKLPINMKPFLPQLQRTFIKGLSETSAQVRENAASATAILIHQQSRLDPIVADLASGLKAAEDRSVKQSFFVVVRSLLLSLGTGRDINVVSKTTLEKMILDATFQSGENDDTLRVQGAQCFSAFVSYLKPEERRKIFESTIFAQSQSSSATFSHGVILSLYCVLRDNSKVLEGVFPEVVSAALRFLDDPNVKLSTEMTTIGVASQLWTLGKLSPDEKSTVLARFSAMMEDRPSDLKRMVLLALERLATADIDDTALYAQPAVPKAWELVRDRTIPVKLAAERALIAMFGLKERSPVMQTYLARLSPTTARPLGDYARRVLTKIADEEGGGEESGKVDVEIESAVFGISS